MKQHELDKLLNNRGLVEERIREFEQKKVITKFVSKSDILGHLAKAEHNLEFAGYQPQKYFDWAITGWYYACYHAALALIITKGY